MLESGAKAAQNRLKKRDEAAVKVQAAARGFFARTPTGLVAARRREAGRQQAQTQ